MYERKLLKDQKERSVLFVGFLLIVGIGIMMIVVLLQQNYKKRCKQKLLQTNLLILPPNLRDELKIPLGKLILNDSSEKESYIQKIYSEKVVITVGDATSELLLGMGLTPLLHIIDGQEKREKRSPPLAESINTELTVKNNPVIMLKKN